MKSDISVSQSVEALALKDIEKGFPGVKALKGVSFSCRPGEVHALLGENGAGKSTLMRVIAGIWQPDAGRIFVRGEPVGITGPRQAQDLGIAMVHQDTRLVPDLDVARNIWLGREPGRTGLIDVVRMQQDAAALLEQLGFPIDVERFIRDLSVAERQVVEIARALTNNPAVLILDEPTSALDAAEIERLFGIVRRLKAQGTAVIFISHRLPEVFAIADRITVLKDGEAIGTVDRDAVTHDSLVAMMVGREVSLTYPPRAEILGEIRLSASNISCEGKFRDVSFDVRAGEILGFGGIQGNGQADVPRALFGLAKWSGEVKLDNAPLTLDTPAKAIASGLVYVPGDRHGEGLFMPHGVRENISVPHLPHWARFGVIPANAENHAADRAIARFAVKTPHREQCVVNLSGGNQQKVVLGRWTAENPVIYFFEDPTRGVDVASKLEIYRQIRTLAAEGAGVVIVTSDLMELIGLSDRILVFSQGRVVDELAGKDATEERIVGSAVGAGGKDSHVMPEVVTSAISRKKTQRPLLSRYGSSLLLALLLVVLVASTASMSDFFLTSSNLGNIAAQVAPLALAALGQFVVILLRGIDLSVGPTISLVTAVISYVAVSESGVDLATAIALSLAIGIAVGSLNALLVVRLGIPDLIATLSTYSIVFGLALIVRPSPGGLVSDLYLDVFSYELWGVPVTAIVVGLIFLLAEFLLLRGRVGQRLYAAGSSPEASFVVGISPKRVQAAAYLFCSVCAALAGMLITARIGSGDPQAGSAFTLASVTAVVVGGASVFGGRGTAVGTLLGAVAVGIMQNALNLMHVSAYYQYIWTGLLTLVAVAAYSLHDTTHE
ncbi:ATP-binding cassette domain-containing protein [Pleomorphomonas koreensis]|uniref:ATP-binding cassette domain-containing protein n=1 Tax=Pleomorphomonas koreensis TaxID=257440 RepID=UPI000A020137|nr:ATP-binding cassette domain-containing protein [Pleomorphomonas koreensis]